MMCYNNNIDRLLSFAVLNLPSQTSVELAQSGFYYCKSTESLKCHSCGQSIKNFLNIDDVKTLHDSASLQCRYTNERNVSGKPQAEVSVKIPGAVQPALRGDFQKDFNYIDNQSKSEHATGDFCNENYELCDKNPGSEIKAGNNSNELFSFANNPRSAYEMKINRSYLMYPDYSHENTRVKSFEGWRVQFQSPKTLARCGFFYTRGGDHVRCFACGGGLKQWRPDDDPWIEHSKWFPGCVFLKMTVGDDFINTIQSGLPDKVEIDKAKVSNKPSTKRQMNLCKICMTKEAVAQTSPCLHTACCRSCVRGVIRCPLCAGVISSVV